MNALHWSMLGVTNNKDYYKYSVTFIGRMCLLSSLDASSDKHNYNSEFVEKFIAELGTVNVLQVVTDGTSNNMKGSKILELKKTNTYTNSLLSCCQNTHNSECSSDSKDPHRYVLSYTKSLHIM